MIKSMKIVLLLVALCFALALALPSPGNYWSSDMDYNRPGGIGPFYMGPYCDYKCAMKCWRMGFNGVCSNYMCMCQ